MALGARPAQPEVCRDLAGKAALLQILDGWRRRAQLAQIMRLGGAEQLGRRRLSGRAASRAGLLARTARLFGNGHTDRAGKRAHGLGETGARVLHQESDGAAMSSATEAVVKLLGGADSERRAFCV